jgi:hypothetical protein
MMTRITFSTVAICIFSFGLLGSVAVAQPVMRPSTQPTPTSNANLIAQGYIPPSITVAPGSQSKAKVTFTFTPTEGRTLQVHLAGTFNDWNERQFLMARTGQSFTITVELPFGVHEYKFVTTQAGNQVVWREDPLNQLNTDDMNGGRNSLLLLNPPGGAGPGSASGGGNSFANRGEPIRWNTDVATARAEAQRGQKAILAFFASSSATASRFIEDTIFTDGRVRDIVSRQFVPLRIDMQFQSNIATQLGVMRGGTIVVYNAQTGQPMGKIERPQSPERILQDIEDILAGRPPTPVPMAPRTNP